MCQKKPELLVTFYVVNVIYLYYIKSDTLLSEMDDGSNESLFYFHEELDPNLQTGTPFSEKF